MSKKCEDCGCTLRSGICTNCNEELYIADYQNPSLDEPIILSKKFTEVANQQREKLRNKKHEKVCDHYTECLGKDFCIC